MDQRGQLEPQEGPQPRSKRRRLGSDNLSDQVENPPVTPSLVASDDELALHHDHHRREDIDTTPRPHPRPRKPRTPAKGPSQGPGPGPGPGPGLSHSHGQIPSSPSSRRKTSHEASSLGRGQSLSESSASTTSASTSGASYPRRRLNALRIADSDRVEVRSLTAETRGLPSRLKRFSQEMAEVLSGVGVVSKSPFLETGTGTGTGRGTRLPSTSVLPQWAYAADADADTRDRLGPTPTLRQVKTIFRDAVHAQDAMYSEHGWNCTVHAPLLKLAMATRCFLDDGDDGTDGDDGGGDGDEDGSNGENDGNKDTPLGLDFVPCTTARIINEYRPNSPAPSKMIDYVLTLALSPTDGGNGPHIDPLRRIKHLCLSSPLGSINHTDFAPLQFTPIAVSIETKKPGRSGGDEEAQLQMGVWQASQWKQLANLLYRVHLERIQDGDLQKTSSPRSTTSLAQEQARATHLAQDAISNLPFLPAIIVSGHDWSFAATTRDGSCTTLWADTQFGTTRTIRGIYSIVYGLQRLARWSREVFQPWYAHHILQET